eukprot:UN11456
MIFNTVVTAVFILTSISEAGSRWLEFDDIGYPSNHKLDLSGGINSNQYKYTAPNGIAVIESSVARWQNSDYYYLSNLFDGSLYYRTHGSAHAHSYWLGQCDSTQTATITITFDQPQNISHIVVEARTIWKERWSWYAIDAYEDAADLVSGDVVEAVHVTQMVDTDNDHFGQVHAHSVKGENEMLVFYILKT